ncbi:flavin reductase [Sphingomonas cavernae]|uniref:Flavin reductase n=1 Tax=Sphingomonas cavernae TaxID=2320861 RepID=A0A418WPH1_9SPHN|nr:flavin reductase [Sphingomonas cavernae]RJF93121.1 flavin reductase [Sphingomonas cavernae]
MTANPDSRAFRDALGSFATGVTIVTATDAEGRDVGLTASSFNSVSLDPPMILWSLARSSQSMAAFREAAHFAVHILAADQDPLSNRFAKSGTDKFADVPIERGEGGVPLLTGCSARFECRTAYQYEGGDHIIFVGEVTRFDRYERPPLIFHGGRYALAARKAQALSAGGAIEQPAGSFGEDFLGYLLGRAHFQLYARMQASLGAHGLDAWDHFILSVLGIGDGRSIAEIEAVIGYTGAHATPERVRSLAARGILSADPDGGRLWLTEQGRKTLVELTAAAKAAEEDALGAFDENETALLKHLLKHVIRSTDPGLPDPWLATAEQGA